MVHQFRAHPVLVLFTRANAMPLLGYGALLLGFATVTWLALASLASIYAEYAAATDMLGQIEGREAAAGGPIIGSGPAKAGLAVS